MRDQWQDTAQLGVLVGGRCCLPWPPCRLPPPLVRSLKWTTFYSTYWPSPVATQSGLYAVVLNHLGDEHNAPRCRRKDLKRLDVSWHWASQPASCLVSLVSRRLHTTSHCLKLSLPCVPTGAQKYAEKNHVYLCALSSTRTTRTARVRLNSWQATSVSSRHLT